MRLWSRSSFARPYIFRLIVLKVTWNLNRPRGMISGAFHVTEETVTALRALVADDVRVLGPDHLETLNCRGALAFFTGKAGDVSAAVTGLRDVLADHLRVLGPNHPFTLESRRHLAEAIGDAGDPRGAVAALRDVLTDQTRLFGPDHHDTLETRAKLAEWTIRPTT